MSSLQGTVRRMTEDDLEKVLTWRNHPDVRQYMFTRHEISFEEHSNWFKRASQDHKRHLLVFEIDKKPTGFINIHEIAVGGIADWGFYASPAAPKGVGRALGNAALSYVFETIRAHKLCAQVLSFNERSNHFHQNLGFHREGILRQQHYDGENYHDVICFGLLSNEWTIRN